MSDECSMIAVAFACGAAFVIVTIKVFLKDWGNMVQSHQKPEPSPQWPEFERAPVVAKTEPVKVVEFQPQFDIDVMFDRIIGEPVAEKARAKAEAERKRKEAMVPIRQAFDRMIKTRKPMVSGGEPLKISDNRFRTDTSEVSFDLHPGIGVRFVGVEWSQEKSYRVYSFDPIWASVQESDRTNDYYDNWREAYKRALELLAPHVIGYDGKEAG